MGDEWEVWATIWRRFFNFQTALNRTKIKGLYFHDVEYYSLVMHMDFRITQNRIEEALQEIKKDRLWLSNETGIGLSELSRIINNKKPYLQLPTAKRIAIILKKTVDYLWPD